MEIEKTELGTPLPSYEVNMYPALSPPPHTHTYRPFSSWPVFLSLYFSRSLLADFTYLDSFCPGIFRVLARRHRDILFLKRLWLKRLAQRDTSRVKQSKFTPWAPLIGRMSSRDCFRLATVWSMTTGHWWVSLGKTLCSGYLTRLRGEWVPGRLKTALSMSEEKMCSPRRGCKSSLNASCWCLKTK